jgi:hypothetical protein
MLFNNLSQNVKNSSSDAIKFKYAFKKFLHVGSLAEYFEWRAKEALGSYK